MGGKTKIIKNLTQYFRKVRPADLNIPLEFHRTIYPFKIFVCSWFKYGFKLGYILGLK
jgi:hypothetical protein